MAQAVYSGHPLEDYLLDAEEEVECMPGIVPDFTKDQSGPSSPFEWYWVPGFFSQALNAASHALSNAQSSSQRSTFSERFKYDVITSSLLSSSLSSSHTPPHRPASPSPPGKLSVGHSRQSSVEETANLISKPTHVSALVQSWPETAGFAIAGAFFGTGYYVFAALTLGGLAYYVQTSPSKVTKSDMSPCLDALSELITAGDFWIFVIQEAIAILEKEEQNDLYGSHRTPFTPSSSTIRVALQSSLLATQVQCDNVRHLLSALTTPSELSQLSEMYGPPSPARSPSRTRPLSLPASHHRISSPHRDRKSTSWNGAQTSLASISPLVIDPSVATAAAYISNPPAKNKSQRPNVSFLNTVAEDTPTKPPGTHSAPVTPFVESVRPNTGAMVTATSFSLPGSPVYVTDREPYFGAAALELQRRHRLSGLEALSSGLHVRGSRSTTFSPASRFTTLQTSTARHPLSLSSLRHALQGALIAKRYACAHLLALRFDEDEDESSQSDDHVPKESGYWEDVRSVMELLTSTLCDNAGRLTVALDEAAHTEEEQSVTVSALEASSSSEASPQSTHHRQQSTTTSIHSFAPMPSHLARFAAHVDAISTALDEAKEQLAQCVAALLKQPDDSQAEQPCNDGQVQSPPPLRSYEQLRKELGLALRECERGRERLLDVITTSSRASRGADLTDEEEELPALGHDACSEESDKPDPTSFSLLFGDEGRSPPDTKAQLGNEDENDDIDDATRHLLMTATPQHLPPPGIEQVFEADTGPAVPFSRERSKLSREERIRLMKEKRESGSFVSKLPVPTDLKPKVPTDELWGPSGEVVQELKDVIWKVGEQRRRRLAQTPESKPVI